MYKKSTQEVTITTDYITLGQLLKYADVIKSGGEVKSYLGSHEIRVNNELETRRGRKLRKNDVIECDEVKIIVK